VTLLGAQRIHRLVEQLLRVDAASPAPRPHGFGAAPRPLG
jgi:hypothetical protein